MEDEQKHRKPIELCVFCIPSVEPIILCVLYVKRISGSSVHNERNI
jgi:hypothetical protein